MEDNIQKIRRRKFFQLCGSLVAGGSIAGLSAFLLHKRWSYPEELRRNNSVRPERDAFLSPYKRASSFKTPGIIEAFELTENRIIAAVSNQILIYDADGKLVNTFAIGSNLRDIATGGGHIYLLFPARIEVYRQDGEWLREWEACSDQSDYCSMAVASGTLFVTDAANKNICQYTTEGGFVRFIQSPDGFIIPSYSFGITCVNGIMYCSNPGRHRVEKYTPDGEYIASFGKAGGAAGMFCGCCNPVYVEYAPTGEIITSEKGNPRISCYSPDGEFRSLLLDSKALGGGNTAYHVKVSENKLVVAGKDLISTFQYDKTLAAKTACSDCKTDCPLRAGLKI